MNINEQCLLNFLKNPDRIDINILNLENYLFCNQEIPQVNDREISFQYVAGR